MIKKLIGSPREVILYLISGALVTAVSWVTYYIPYNLLGLSNMVSEIISWVLAVAVAYVTNKIWVFKSDSWAMETVKPELTKFVSMRLFSGVLEWALMWLLVDKLGYDGMLMKILVSILVVIINYIASKLLIFIKKPENSQK